jgi:hypothetical protein
MLIDEQPFVISEKMLTFFICLSKDADFGILSSFSVDFEEISKVARAYSYTSSLEMSTVLLHAINKSNIYTAKCKVCICSPN